MLLADGQPATALVEFEASQRTEPNRFRSLFGAGRAAAASGDRARAQQYYTRLLELCRDADTERPELRQAKDYLGRS
jgi:Tfp pilus assembly protein PilF